MDLITSVKNPGVQAYRELIRRGAQDRVALEGFRLVQDAVNSDVCLAEVYMTDRAYASPRGKAIARLCPQASLISDRVAKAMADTDNPQGVFAVALWAPLSAGDTDGLTLALDGVSDPGNVGTLIRTAAAMGLNRVVVGRRSARPNMPKTIRASMGAVFRIEVAEAADLAAYVCLARGRGASVVISDTDGGSAPWDAHIGTNAVVIIGGEAAGVSAGVRAHADLVVTIPMARDVESLNASAAGAILMYELVAAKARRQASF